jgi:hypothetical protein
MHASDGDNVTQTTTAPREIPRKLAETNKHACHAAFTARRDHVGLLARFASARAFARLDIHQAAA